MFRRTISLVAAGAVAISLGVLFAPGGAIAQQAPPVPVVTPASGPPGTVVTVTVPGCTGVVTAALASQQGDVLAINSGTGDTVTLTVPTDAPQGEILVVAGCDVYSENDFNVATFTVTAAATASQPQFTG